MTYAQMIKNKLTPGSTAPINVLIYARVSTDNEGQRESCANQVALAKNYISSHPNMNLRGTFVDDGISGKNDFNRPQYNEMLQLIEKEHIDLIIVKSTSRLNRDKVNAMSLENYLLGNETTILTLDDGQVHDFEDINSDLLNTLQYSMDASYVRRQSMFGRKTHELRCQNKILSAKDCSFGYDWNRDSKTISVNPERAEIVRFIFEEYVFRSSTPASIKKMLDIKGFPMCERTITKLIQDERYIGKFYINKRTTKLGTGQRKSQRIMLPREQWILIEKPELQIVDSDLFEMAQRIHKNKITVYERPDKASTQARFQGSHLFAGKVFCPVCGKPYRFGYSDRKNTIPVYRLKSHSDCSNPNRHILEADLLRITRQTLKTAISDQKTVCDSLERILLSCVEASQNNDDEIKNLKAKLASREKKLDNLMDYLADGGLSEDAKSRMMVKINDITTEISNYSAAIKDKESNKLNVSYVTEKVAKIKAALKELKQFTSLDRDRILNYVERIEIQSSGDINIVIKSGQLVTINNDFSEDSCVGNLRIPGGQC